MPDTAQEARLNEEHTVRVARKRFARRQRARRWLAWRKVLVGVLVLGLAGGATWLVLFSSTLAVSGVVVEGTQVLTEREVRTAADMSTGGPLATVDLTAIAARVENLAPVAYVDVSRSWPDKVRIVVVEREAVAVVARDGEFRGLDENGVLFRGYARRPDLPVVRMSASTRTEALAEAAQVVAALPADLTRRVDHVEVRTMDTISLHLRNGDTIFWGSADASADKVRVIEILLERNATVYDVSVPGQPTIRR